MTCVLLVDDYPLLLQHYSRWLAQRCEVHTAQTALEALDLMDNHADITSVVTDFHMPGHTGLWLLDQARRRCPEAQRVLMSVTLPNEADEALESGLVHCFLHKPFDGDALVDCVRAGRPKSSEVEVVEPKLAEILHPDKLRAMFQPIFEVTGDRYRLHAVEGLIRGPKGSPLERADVLFNRVRSAGAEEAADLACVATLLRAAAGLPQHVRININVHATTIIDIVALLKVLMKETRENRVSPDRLVIEVVEYAPELVGQRFKAGLNALRQLGTQIAVDDIGSGRSNYRKLFDCAPDCLKIDRFFVQQCHDDFRRQAVLESVALLASKLQASVVAEGVETTDELEMVGRFGIRLIQGYLLGRPQPVEVLVDEPYLDGHQRRLDNAQAPAEYPQPPGPFQHSLGF